MLLLFIRLSLSPSMNMFVRVCVPSPSHFHARKPCRWSRPCRFTVRHGTAKVRSPGVPRAATLARRFQVRPTALCARGQVRVVAAQRRRRAAAAAARGSGGAWLYVNVCVCACVCVCVCSCRCGYGFVCARMCGLRICCALFHPGMLYRTPN